MKRFLTLLTFLAAIAFNALAQSTKTLEYTYVYYASPNESIATLSAAPRWRLCATSSVRF